MLGTNGGGFFNANSAHPFENPTPFSNFVQMLMIFLIPAGSDLHLRARWSATRGRAGRCSPRAASCSWLGVFVVYHYEQAGNPILANLGLQSAASDSQPGGNMEGKETRFGIAASSLFASDHHRRELRRRERHARQLYASRRAWCRCSTSRPAK